MPKARNGRLREENQTRSAEAVPRRQVRHSKTREQELRSAHPGEMENSSRTPISAIWSGLRRQASHTLSRSTRQVGLAPAADLVEADRDEGTDEEEAGAERQHEIGQVEPEQQRDGQPAGDHRHQAAGQAGARCAPQVAPAGGRARPTAGRPAPVGCAAAARRKTATVSAHAAFPRLRSKSELSTRPLPALMQVKRRPARPLG